MLGRVGTGFRVWRMARLVWPLLRDPRVPFPIKLVPPAALLYLFFPVDLVPDFFPALGQLDDLTVLFLSLLLFVRLCPEEVVREHVRPTTPRQRKGRTGTGGSGGVIDGEYEVLDQDAVLR